MILLGIDPGLSGALAWLDHDGNVLAIEDMPTHELKRGGKIKRDIDRHRLAALLDLSSPHRPGHVFIEQVGAMPGQGVTSMFAFGKTYGIVLGAVAAKGLPSSEVTPAVWKKRLGLATGKDAARKRASELLPGAAHRWPLVKHDGRAEAALIALYGARSLAGIATDSRRIAA